MRNKLEMRRGKLEITPIPVRARCGALSPCAKRVGLARIFGGKARWQNLEVRCTWGYAAPAAHGIIWVVDPFTLLIERRPELAPCLPDLQRLFVTLTTTFRRGGKLLLCGNGGSAMDAGHLAAELMKGFRRPRLLPPEEVGRLAQTAPDQAEFLARNLQRGLPALSLADPSALLTAIANDQAPELVFAQQVVALGRPGDALLCLSTSGASINVLHAARVARAYDLFVLAFTGPDGGPLAALCDVCVRAPGGSTEIVQENHLALYHTLCAALEDEFFGPQAA